jgi:RNA polymerase-interacting CarD/CdnL/TRCF family regulator
VRIGTAPRAVSGRKEDTIPTEATQEMAPEEEELVATEEVEYIEFELGDHVVYPHHGAGKVMKKEEMEMLGERREYLTIKILHNDMTVRVPTENAAIAGLRRVIDEETVKKVLDVLRDEVSEMPKNWNRRFKHNRDKIKTGDIYELAEVVRNHQEDPRLGAHVCARQGRGRGRALPRRVARGLCFEPAGRRGLLGRRGTQRSLSRTPQQR